jgi:hypothetical protein
MNTSLRNKSKENTKDKVDGLKEISEIKNITQNHGV